MDVHVITDANKAAYAAELDQLFRIRHRIYVEEKKGASPRMTVGKRTSSIRSMLSIWWESATARSSLGRASFRRPNPIF